jgi:predicted RNase H-like nuclease (RuvC/YqgF family)
MTAKRLLRRLDDHLAVANAHMARGNQLWAENRDALVEFRRTTEDLRRTTADLRETTADLRETTADLRQSIEDMRVELRRTSQRGQRVAEQFEAEVRLSREQREKERTEDRTILRDLLAESRAGRDALFVILDELRGRGQGPATAGA